MLDEIRLLADAFRGVGSMLEECPDYLDRLCADSGCPGGSDVFTQTIETALTAEELDRKWDVESEDLLSKINHLSMEARRKIVIGIAEFRERSGSRREESLHWVLDEINTEKYRTGSANT